MKNKQPMIQIVLIVLLGLGVSSNPLHDHPPRLSTKVLRVSNGGQYGSWGPFCGKGAYAVGYAVEEPDGDNTALNAISLRCETRENGDFSGHIESSPGHWGDWHGEAKCRPKNFLTAFSLQVETIQNTGDDTAANWIKFKCRSFNEGNVFDLNAQPGDGEWGTFGGWSESCPLNSAICGIQTKVENPQGGGDDTALNDVRFFCCSY